MDNTHFVHTQIAQFRILRPGATLPTYGTPRSACFDVSAYIDDDGIKVATSDGLRDRKPLDGRVTLYPSERCLIPTGWAVQCPHGCSFRMYSRSGLSIKNGIILANGTGVIDEDYRQEVHIMLMNMSTVPFNIHHGDRLCQGEFTMDVRIPFVVSTVNDEEWFNTQRSGGFGSTGITTTF